MMSRTIVHCGTYPYSLKFISQHDVACKCKLFLSRVVLQKCVVDVIEVEAMLLVIIKENGVHVCIYFKLLYGARVPPFIWFATFCS